MTKQSIRVLCVFSTLDRGGAETMCLNLYRHINRDKVQFDFVKHTHKRGAFEDEIDALGGRVYEAPRFKIYNWVQYRKWWIRHLKEHQEHHIIHGYFFSISAVYFVFCKHMGRKTIGHIHASKSDGRIKEFLEQCISRYTDYPLACSQQAGQWIYGDRPFTVLNNAIDAERFRFDPETRATYRRQLKLGDSIVLGTVANMSTVKNPMGLIDIFCEVKKQRPDAILVWVGEGECRAEIENRLQQEKMTDSVHLVGTRNDVPDLLQAMDAFLLPSFSEGLPVSAIEAQATGLPCFISSRVTTEVDVTGLCRFLPIDKPGLWAQAILNERTQRIDTSARIIAAGYDIHSTAKWLEEFYLSIS